MLSAITFAIAIAARFIADRYYFRSYRLSLNRYFQMKNARNRNHHRTLQYFEVC